jgi:hypothetical protein
MTAFYVMEGLTEPDVRGAGDNYTMHLREWGNVGMALSAVGVVIALCGRGAARILMTVLMVTLFTWWWFVEGASHITF